jgi:hypothetical protein
MIDIKTYWPDSLRHLAEPYYDGVSEHVVIAEVNDGAINGCKGAKHVCTALVPLGVVDDVLVFEGGIGWEVRSWGPMPCVDPGQIYDTQFWIDGRRGKDEKFQTVINAWKRHDREVVLPDNIMLMTYGLVPRYLADGTVCWDDPQGPVYDVIRARSHVNYNAKSLQPSAFVTMRRDYLEDFCSLKGCAAVAVYYEERHSIGDQSFDQVLAGSDGKEFNLPGRLLGLAVLKGRYQTTAPQFARVWGSALILKPSGRPISEADDPVLEWPGHAGAMSQQRAAQDWLYGYVSDAVLTEYESHQEYTLHPESGGVSYGGWWGTNYTNRIGREHIQVELKKLYEGCPPSVIAHWHKYSVLEAIARKDRDTNGNRNIAVRAKSVALGYLRLTEAVARISDRLGAGFSQEEIGSLSTSTVDYSGWWTQPEFAGLSAVVRLNANQEQFLARAIVLFKVAELLQPAALRNLVLKLGVPSEKIKGFAGLKLLGTLLQLAAVARENGYDFWKDTSIVVGNWDTRMLLPEMNRLFALNGLRVLAAHVPGTEKDKKLSELTKSFGIDLGSTVTGWGLAIDALYDGISSDIEAIAGHLEAVCG